MRGSAGFTLLELLVAIVIAGLAFAVLLLTAAEGRAILENAAISEAALAVAHNRLAFVEADLARLPDHTWGQEGGFTWTVDIATEAIVPPPADVVTAFLRRGDARAALCAIRVRVAWGTPLRSQQVQIKTHRLKFLAPAEERRE